MTQSTVVKEALEEYRQRMIADHKSEAARMANEAKWANFLIKWHDSEVERLGKGFSPTTFDVYMEGLYGKGWSNL